MEPGNCARQISNLDLIELQRFGEEADRLEYPAIAEGGFIVPGVGPSPSIPPATRGGTSAPATSGSEEAGPAADARQRPSAEAATARPAAHPLDRRLNEVLKFGELREYHPGTRVVRSSPDWTLLAVPVGLFATLPYRATLFLEVPHEAPANPTPCVLAIPNRLQPLVPPVRAWAVSSTGVWLSSPHEYPDRSMCACMPGEWLWGRDPLCVYVDWCITWIGKALHAQLLGRWPGPQHLPHHLRQPRAEKREYCGCGSARRYQECCMEPDREISGYQSRRAAVRGSHSYEYTLEVQRRPAFRDWAPLAAR